VKAMLKKVQYDKASIVATKPEECVSIDQNGCYNTRAYWTDGRKNKYK
jgi:hypothetical protein